VNLIRVLRKQIILNLKHLGSKRVSAIGQYIAIRQAQPCAGQPRLFAFDF
jgi:hypothetical protein